jgi:NAD(P)-dependent dehydrogenase (short-subunit alcohol dehydrogenase family)
MAEKYAQRPPHLGFNFTPTIHHDAPAKLDPRKVKIPEPCSVLITGAGRGLGEAHAIAFAQAGASDIILTSRTLLELENVKGKILAVNPTIKVSTIVCDVSNHEDVLELEKHVRKEHGRLDVLDNNAGFLDHGWCPITEVPADEFARVFEVNVVGVFLVTRTLLPLMLQSSNGQKCIFGITSLSSHVTGESIAMGMSKLALNRFMEYIGVKYAEQGVVTYSIMPGGVPTEMNMGGDRVPEGLKASTYLTLRLCFILQNTWTCLPCYSSKEWRHHRGVVSCIVGLAGKGAKTMVEWTIHIRTLGP